MWEYSRSSGQWTWISGEDAANATGFYGTLGTAAAANGYSSALFYMITYVLTTLGTFGLVMYLSRHGFESEQISDLAGLGKRSPWIAGVMALFMFSLAKRCFRLR